MAMTVHVLDLLGSSRDLALARALTFFSARTRAASSNTTRSASALAC
jgi:hypothetical protein